MGIENGEHVNDESKSTSAGRILRLPDLVRSGICLAFPEQLGFPRWALRSRLGRRAPRQFVDPSGATAAKDYSKEWFSKYRPQRRVRFPLFLLASIPDVDKGSLLIIGPRYESEFFLARGLGWARAGLRGLDTFTYSTFVDLGDMHDMPFEDGSFGSVVCAWTISYSTQPAVAAAEMIRVVRPGGYVVLAVDKVEADTETVPEVLRGEGVRVQTLRQFDELFVGCERVAGFEPASRGQLVVGYRKPWAVAATDEGFTSEP